MNHANVASTYIVVNAKDLHSIVINERKVSQELPISNFDRGGIW